GPWVACGDGEVGLGLTAPPPGDLVWVGGRVEEAVPGGGLLAARLAGEHRPAMRRVTQRLPGCPGGHGRAPAAAARGRAGGGGARRGGFGGGVARPRRPAAGCAIRLARPASREYAPGPGTAPTTAPTASPGCTGTAGAAPSNRQGWRPGGRSRAGTPARPT